MMSGWMISSLLLEAELLNNLWFKFMVFLQLFKGLEVSIQVNSIEYAHYISRNYYEVLCEF